MLLKQLFVLSAAALTAMPLLSVRRAIAQPTRPDFVGTASCETSLLPSVAASSIDIKVWALTGGVNRYFWTPTYFFGTGPEKNGVIRPEKEKRQDTIVVTELEDFDVFTAAPGIGATEGMVSNVRVDGTSIRTLGGLVPYFETLTDEPMFEALTGRSAGFANFIRFDCDIADLVTGFGPKDSDKDAPEGIRVSFCSGTEQECIPEAFEPGDGGGNGCQ